MKAHNLIILLPLIFSININCSGKEAHTNLPANNINVEKERASDSFTFIIPLHYNNKEYSIQLLCEKDSVYTNVSSITSNLPLPKEFYTILQDNFNSSTGLINTDYESAYENYKNLKFKRTDFVEYEKKYVREFSSKLLYIFDVDQDGYEDILLLDLQNSMRDNDVYVMFKGGKNGISLEENFFNKAAFYGWDKTGKYLITGMSDAGERKLYKNQVVGDKLKRVDQCTEYAVSDKFCW
ncbi:hypothetical protein SAMN05421866_1967 [Chryseobacterium oranimense]|uniref:Uncharacterized protein n=1 Tax=Chryseobacterium oranimense TaxID=421058 RepID=A0A1M5PVJ0_9FLAO|nr:hypothetical protein [Chryseobacterium oranimense]SHH05571.1 hypothetical protein SAMN05421866_1967 [Chryseobacterium oranimense]